MKLIRENFLQPITVGLKYGFAAILLGCSLHAAEQEIWYDSEGNPILTKDKTTGRMRVITAAELAAMQKPVEKPAATATEQTESEPEAEQTVVDSSQHPELVQDVPIVDRNSVIPMLLAPKIYADDKYYLNRSSYYYTPSYHSTYPYISRPVIPRFSNNGYYQPAQYYRPQYRHYHHGNHGHHRKHHYGQSGNGFFLRYSRSGLNIRARF